MIDMATPTEKISLAEAEALKRRERLLKLKQKAEGKSSNADKEENGSQSPSSSISDTESQNEGTETQEAPETETRITQRSILDEELDLNQLAPRKIDWDLKRDIERELEILEDRTNDAIAELIRKDMVDDIV